MSDAEIKTTEESEDSKREYRRSLFNFLLEPYTQMRMGIYANLIAIGFIITVGAIFYLRLSEFFNIIMELTELEEEVLSIAQTYLSEAIMWFSVMAIIFMILNILISVIYTHKMVGPAYALRKHIRSLILGEYQSRTYLRKGDTMKDVALELNRLSEMLEKKFDKQPLTSEQPHSDLKKSSEAGV